MNPTVSVVIPTFNRCDSLKRTLDGLTHQSYPPSQFEVIVVSDGSTDGTDAMLEEATKTLPYTLRWFSQVNRGPSYARNRGILEAHGSVVLFIDDDVDPSPGLLWSHASRHERDPSIAVIGPMSPDPKMRGKEPAWIGWEHAMLERQYQAWRTGEWEGAGPNHFYSGNASVGREHLRAIGGFDVTFKRQEDVELAHRLARERYVHFEFAEDAAALHRPRRTFASWINTPAAYGSLDVIRARRTEQPLDWNVVRQSYTTRNRITRLLADVTSAVPGSLVVLREVLRCMATFCWSCHWDAPALAALSAIYNLYYLAGARKELGSEECFQRLLREEGSPTPRPAYAPVVGCREEMSRP